MKTFHIRSSSTSPSTVEIIDKETGIDIADRVCHVEIIMKREALIEAKLTVLASVDLEADDVVVTNLEAQLKLAQVEAAQVRRSYLHEKWLKEETQRKVKDLERKLEQFERRTGGPRDWGF